MVRQLVVLNESNSSRSIQALNGVDDIRGIYWHNGTAQKRHSTLVIQFARPEQASDAALGGMYWWGQRYLRNILRPDRRTVRCGRCQAYRHLKVDCSAAYRCGKCAESHATSECASQSTKYASCRDNHYASSKYCHEKAKARWKLRCSVEPEDRAPAASTLSSPASTPTTSQDNQEITAEEDQSDESTESVPDKYPDTPNLLKQLEDLRAVILARDEALRSNRNSSTARKQKVEERPMEEASACPTGSDKLTKR